MNEDSTWTYIFMADPFIDNSTTSILKPLEQRYGNDESQKILDVWSSCFTNKGQESFFGQDILFSGFKNKIKSKSGNTIMIVLNYIKPMKKQSYILWMVKIKLVGNIKILTLLQLSQIIRF